MIIRKEHAGNDRTESFKPQCGTFQVTWSDMKGVFVMGLGNRPNIIFFRSNGSFLILIFK